MPTKYLMKPTIRRLQNINLGQKKHFYKKMLFFCLYFSKKMFTNTYFFAKPKTVMMASMTAQETAHIEAKNVFRNSLFGIINLF